VVSTLVAHLAIAGPLAVTRTVRAYRLRRALATLRQASHWPTALINIDTFLTAVIGLTHPLRQTSIKQYGRAELSELCAVLDCLGIIALVAIAAKRSRVGNASLVIHTVTMFATAADASVNFFA